MPPTRPCRRSRAEGATPAARRWGLKSSRVAPPNRGSADTASNQSTMAMLAAVTDHGKVTRLRRWRTHRPAVRAAPARKASQRASIARPRTYTGLIHPGQRATTVLPSENAQACGLTGNLLVLALSSFSQMLTDKFARMDIRTLRFPVLLVIVPRKFGDARGFLSETYSDATFSAKVAPVRFVQEGTTPTPSTPGYDPRHPFPVAAARAGQAGAGGARCDL